MILYGLPTCDTCKKAIKALEASGKTVEFRDVRAEPLSETEWAGLVAEVGSDLVNTRSTTWRGLSDWMKHSEPETQLAQHPALMKRPLIFHDGRYFLGWDENVQSQLLGGD